MRGDDIALARLRRLGGLDWTGIVRQAARRGLAPLLYQRLRTLSSRISIPDAALRALRTRYLRNATRNALVYRQLSALVRTLQEGSIQVALLKGAHLAAFVYGNVALRPMADVDVLVRRTDVQGAGEALLGAGYTPHPSNAWWRKNGYYHVGYVPPAGGVNVELHWDIDRWPAGDHGQAEGLWQRAEAIRLDGVDALSLSAEDLLLHVCLHTCSQHLLMNGLLGLCDVSAIVEHHGAELQWGEVGRRAGQWAVGKPVQLTLRLARELLGAPVPERALGMLEPDGLEAQAAAWAKEILLADTMSMPRTLFRLRRAKRPRDRAIILFRGAFPSVDAVAAARAMRRNSPWIYPYYVVRLLLVLGRSAAPMWGMLRGDEALRALLDDKTALRGWLEEPQGSRSPVGEESLSAGGARTAHPEYADNGGVDAVGKS
jgi:hypothetical protein